MTTGIEKLDHDDLVDMYAYEVQRNHYNAFSMQAQPFNQHDLRDELLRRLTEITEKYRND